MGNQHSFTSSSSTWHNGRFSASELERIQRRLTRIGRGRPELAACDLRNMVPNNPFVDSIFELYDTDHDGLLLYGDVHNLLRDIASALASHDRNKQIRFAFHVFDRNRDGLLDHDELMTVLESSCFSKNIPTEELDSLVDALLQSAGAGRDGLNIEEFERLLLNRPSPVGLQADKAIVEQKYQPGPMLPVENTKYSFMTEQ